ncbi:PiT family inorganic phosphate transporter [Halanaerobium saccharolyticum]|jgi:PiT family inorganic phosphate transporter|uniref:PiT family inorganic phosphate transporter n=1 Tax=Halanaerobium saccharolyticum TaxID=43595 RepID=A0A2T5RHI0_9FIRM|nr:inorganic phosphate transporter [Halanaerobium saccharolyticum]PTV96164.1 PiT family inorganic phosphate transporter [Halanaerobium saccharolyticum]TDP98249.1 PiT family inorganic phosphate transporter [Halanaerobium saccharolyticum]
MIEVIIYLSSGLFLGWSLGANDAANIFGTAVGSKMVKFSTAALIMTIFVILGSVVSGAGASHTLGALGQVGTLPAAFVVAFAAAVAVSWMTKLSLPVSTSHSIVGGIIGWNLYSGYATDLSVLREIVGAWIFSPVLSAFFAVVLYFAFRKWLNNARVHLLQLDFYTRWGLLIVGAFGAYSLGANNIANVMGVFTGIMEIPAYNLSIFSFSGAQQLFLLGGIAISVGVVTYSKRVMLTVGSNIMDISPIGAFIVVLASSTTLFVFASAGLKDFLIMLGLPSFPLVPVSSSQAVVGAVLGLGLAKGGRNINFKLLGKIGVGWILTPITAAVISFILLFFMQNVFIRSVV